MPTTMNNAHATARTLSTLIGLLLLISNVLNTRPYHKKLYRTRQKEPQLTPTTRIFHPEPWKSRLPFWLAESNSTILAPPQTPGAFLHVGKTGGSTLTTQLRNGCHSWIPKPCRIPANESRLSRLTTYYHTPDFTKLNDTEHYHFYVMTVRDPYDRLLSAFTFLHPANIQARREKMRGLPPGHWNFFSCFPDLDTFAEAVGNEPEAYEDPWPAVVANTTNCTNLARASLNNKVKGFEHAFFDTKYVVNHLPDTWRQNQTMLVIRTEALWDDWISLNHYLGQENVTTFPDQSLRISSKYKQPVSKKLSGPHNRNRLCRALLSEYQAYLEVIRRAVNLRPDEKQKTLQLARKNCPSLELSFENAKVTKE